MMLERLSGHLTVPYESSIVPLNCSSLYFLDNTINNVFKEKNATDVQVPTFKISNSIYYHQVCIHDVYLRRIQVAPSFSNTIPQRVRTYNSTKYEPTVYRPCVDCWFCWFRQNHASVATLAAVPRPAGGYGVSAQQARPGTQSL